MATAVTQMFKVNITQLSAPLRMMAAAMLYLLLILPPCRQWLESSLVHHMLIQIPLLVVVGWHPGRQMRAGRLDAWNTSGIPGVLIAFFTMLFWMIPRWLDVALSEPLWETIKFISVPLLIGAPLGMSWPRLSSFARAVVWSNAISMLVVIGWLYMAAQIRVCNNYLVNQQETFGYTAMALALAIAFYWIGKTFFGNWKEP